MRLRPLVLLALVLAALGAPAAQGAQTARGDRAAVAPFAGASPRSDLAAAGPFAAAGSGSVRFEARGEALVSSAIVRRGTVRLEPGTGPPFELQCLQPGRAARACARLVRDAGGERWQVLRPVRFLYEGSDFTITVTSQAGFRVLVLGSGRVVMRGTGQWSFDRRGKAYDGVARVDIP